MFIYYYYYTQENPSIMEPTAADLMKEVLFLEEECKKLYRRLLLQETELPNLRVQLHDEHQSILRKLHTARSLYASVAWKESIERRIKEEAIREHILPSHKAAIMDWIGANPTPIGDMISREHTEEFISNTGREKITVDGHVVSGQFDSVWYTTAGERYKLGHASIKVKGGTDVLFWKGTRFDFTSNALNVLHVLAFFSIDGVWGWHQTVAE